VASEEASAEADSLVEALAEVGKTIGIKKAASIKFEAAFSYL